MRLTSQISRPKTIVALACLLVLSSRSFALENGDFETVRDGALAAWKVTAHDAVVRPERIKGEWCHFVCDVKPGRFDKIHLHLSYQQHGVGSLWWDNFTSENLNILNPDFEEIDSDGRLTGWRQDNVGDTIFSDTDRVKHGARSIRMTRKGGIAPTRVWQIIDVNKDADYRFEFDCFLSDDFKGQPNVATLTYESDGKYYGSPMWIRTPSWTEILTERAGESDRIATLDLAGGDAEISQTLTWPARRNGELTLLAKTKALDGALRAVVTDAESGALLGQAVESSPNSAWHEITVPFTNPDPTIRVGLIARGTGRVGLDSVTLADPQLVPPAQEVTWKTADDNLLVNDLLLYHIEGPTSQPIQGALDILRNDLKKLGLGLRPGDPDKHHLDIRFGPDQGVAGKGPESYTLNVDDRNLCTIRAETDVGVLRAIATLVQLLRKYPNRETPEIVACDIRDWPDMPVRGAFWAPAFTWKQFARHKLNMMYLSTSYWLEWHDYPDKVPEMIQYFTDAEKFGVDVLASTGVFQGHEVYRYHDPNLAEGKAVQNERITLSDETPVPLKHPLVLRTKLRGLTLTSSDGRTTYKEGTDYAVARGTPVTYPFNEIKDPVPDAVRRIPTGASPDGATVLASYNYGEPSNKMELCLSEPDATRIPADALAAAFRKFPRLRWFNLNLDEIAYFRMCTLCKASPRSNDQLMCDWINALDRAVKAVCPDARLVTWDDMLCPYVDAANIGIKDPAPLLPKDMLMMSWGYNADFPQLEGWPAVRYWSEHRLSTIVVPWDNRINIRAWAQVVAEARRRGWPCLGMLDSYWHNRHDFRESAICSWRIPREGEKRWVPLDFGSE